MAHQTSAALEAGLAAIRLSPRDPGLVDLLVRRPAIGEREVLTEAILDPVVGLVGDSWLARPSSRTGDGTPHPEMQLNIMNARAAALIAGDRERWPLAGDQFYVDFDLSAETLPAGTRLSIGTAAIEITAQPHTGCAKFSARFGVEALRFVNSPAGKDLRVRGVCAKVVTGGVVRQGDQVRRIV